MRVKFWGVRGSIPSPCTTGQIEEKIIRALMGAQEVDLSDREAVEQYVRSLPLHQRGTYGGNTTCVEVRTARNELIIIDAGTGLRGLGMELMNTEFARGKGEAWMIFTHTHWDHVQGFPFFTPLYIPGNTFHLYGKHSDLEERLRCQQDLRFFPAMLDERDLPTSATPYMKANLEFIVPMPDPLELFAGRMTITTLDLDHPGVSYALRFEEDGKVFIFASDAEYKELTRAAYLQKYLDFYAGADVLVFDAQYTLQETLYEKFNWGHSSAMIGVELASEAGVKTLVLFHHEPAYDDNKIREVIYGNSLRYLRHVPTAHKCEVIVAYEGLELTI